MLLVLKLWVFVCCIVSSVFAYSDKNFLNSPEISIVQKVYDDCKDTNDFTGCLKNKAIVALTKAIDHETIKISNGLIMERQNTTEPESIIGLTTDARTLNSFSPTDRKLLEKIDFFLRSYVLKFDMSSNGADEEGREKKKKDNGIKYVVAALLTAMGIAGPLGLKALAAIAGKALVISKVALTIAGIIALKKLFSHDGHEETSFQVHAGDHNRRNSFLVRPVKASPAATLDPYRYYYEYQQH